MSIPYSAKLIAPYVRGALMASKYGKYARAGMAAANMYKTYKKNRPAKASMSGRKRKRSRISSTKRSGANATQGSGQQYMDMRGATNLAMGLLTIVPVNFTQMTTLNEIGRKSNNIRCSGIKICMNIFNDSPHPMEFHFCLLRAKEKEPSAVTQPWAKTDFFRDPKSSSDRQADFPEADGGYNTALKCWGVNTAKFNVLTHKKMRLGGRNSNISINDSRHVKRIERFFRINKKLSFEQGDVSRPDFPFLIAMWYTSVDPNDYASLTNVMRYEAMNSVYFRSRN